MTTSPGRDGQKVEFKAWCENQDRYDYLVRCLKEPLCSHCGREVAECEPDPCRGAKVESGDLDACLRCGHDFDPHHLEHGLCPECQPPRLSR